MIAPEKSVKALATQVMDTSMHMVVAIINTLLNCIVKYYCHDLTRDRYPADQHQCHQIYAR